MKLELLMTYNAMLKPTIEIGKASFGKRSIAEVTGGSFEGPRLKGKVLTPGADWIIFDGENVGQVDVRASFETHDGAMIYVQYLGKLVINDKVASALAEGKETNFGDTYFMTQPRFETGDERYQWLNNIVAVAEGRILSGGVEYRVYECINGNM